MFNPDITEQAIELIFPVKKKTSDHPELISNGIPVGRQYYTKHLGVCLDSRLNFSKHIRTRFFEWAKYSILTILKSIPHNSGGIGVECLL